MTKYSEAVAPEELAHDEVLDEFVTRHALSPKHREVLRLAARGMGTAQIAKAIGRSKETVNTHWRRISMAHPTFGWV